LNNIGDDDLLLLEECLKLLDPNRERCR